MGETRTKRSKDSTSPRRFDREGTFRGVRIERKEWPSAASSPGESRLAPAVGRAATDFSCGEKRPLAASLESEWPGYDGGLGIRPCPFDRRRPLL